MAFTPLLLRFALSCVTTWYVSSGYLIELFPQIFQPYACETCQRLGRHCSRMHWATPCAACLVSGECCCTFTLRIPFMTAVCAFYGVALHGPRTFFRATSRSLVSYRLILSSSSDSRGRCYRSRSPCIFRGVRWQIRTVPVPGPSRRSLRGALSQPRDLSLSSQLGLSPAFCGQPQQLVILRYFLVAWLPVTSWNNRCLSLFIFSVLRSFSTLWSLLLNQM